MVSQKKPKKNSNKATVKVSRNRASGKKNADLFEGFRSEHPQTDHPLDIISNVLPSTGETDVRPQIIELPSTEKDVDVLPSKFVELPSTNENEKINVDVLPSTGKKLAVHSDKKMPSTKSDRHNKNLARFDNRIDANIKHKIDMFCAEFGFTQREIAEQSAVHFIDMWTAKFQKLVDGKTAHDDRLKMIMWKTDARIINLYRAYNFENKWKFKDDEAAAKYNGADLRLLELGIIETQFNSNFKKINSFGYYKNQIDNFVEQKLSPEMLTFLTNHYRQKWQTATGREVDLTFLDKE